MVKIARNETRLKFMSRLQCENCIRSRKDPESSSAKRMGKIPCDASTGEIRVSRSAIFGTHFRRTETAVSRCSQLSRAWLTHASRVTGVRSHLLILARRRLFVDWIAASPSPPKRDRPLDSTDSSYWSVLQTHKKNGNNKTS